MTQFSRQPSYRDFRGETNKIFQSAIPSVNEILEAGVDPGFRARYIARAYPAWRLGMLLDPGGKHSRRFGISVPDEKARPRSNAEVLEILNRLKPSGNRLILGGNLRGVDGPGSSQDLLGFQVKLTSTGDHVGRMYEMPCTTVLASKFHTGFEVEAADPGDEDKIVYIATQCGRHERRIICDANELINGHGLIEMCDVPAYVFSKYYGIDRGVKITCRSENGMTGERGLENSNAFVLLVSLMGSMLSGRDWSLARAIRQSVYDENRIFGHLTPGITGGQGHISSSIGGAFTIEWLSGLGSGGLSDDESYVYENDSYGAILFPLHLRNTHNLQSRLFLCQPGKEYLAGGEPRLARLSSDTNSEWTKEWDDWTGQRLHLMKKDLHYIWRCALEEGDDSAAAYALNTYNRIRGALSDRYKEWRTASGESVNQDVTYMDTFSQNLFDSVTEVGGGMMPAGGGGPGSICIVYLPENVDGPEFFEQHGLGLFDAASTARVQSEGGVSAGYVPFQPGEEGLRMSPGWKKMGLQQPPGPQLVAVNEESGRVVTLEEFFQISGIPADGVGLTPQALRGEHVEIGTAKNFLRDFKEVYQQP